jgi:hypothetical protein
MKILPQKQGYDHRTVTHNGRTIGYVGDGGDMGLERCPECERENYAMSVASGVCCWCGYDLKVTIEEVG